MYISNKLLSPLSKLYDFFTGLRNILYNKGIFSSKKLPVPVISIGNITAGGTGKTPFTIALSTKLNKNNRVGILTRGYKRRSRGQVIVSKGNGPETSAEKAGDEPYLMAKNTNDTIIIANKNKYEAGLTAVEEYNCNIILIDDGFQHRQLDRDFDIVLWDVSQNPENSKILPAGNLRENLSNLERADALIFTRTDKWPDKHSNYFNIFFPSLPQFIANKEISSLFSIKTGSSILKRKINNKNLLAFCGLGNPDQFYDTVQTLNPSKLISKSFRDHYKYKKKDLNEIGEIAKENNIDYIITTEKDFANFPENYNLEVEILTLSINFKISDKLHNYLTKSIL